VLSITAIEHGFSLGIRGKGQVGPITFTPATPTRFAKFTENNWR